MKHENQVQVWSLLRDAPDYRAFIQTYIDWKKATKPGYGYASLARDAGFTARSYPRDVVLGARPLTAASLPRFIQAMKLAGESARYFSLLVYRDRPELFTGSAGKNLAELLAKSRARLTRQIENRKQEHLTNVYSQSSWPLIYASLGRETEGATLNEISSRSRIPVSDCRQMLQTMESLQIVQRDQNTGRYLSHNPHLIYQGLGNSSGFKDFFIDSLQRARISARKDFNREDRLFFSSVVSVKRSELPRYKAKLRELLDTFAENVESPDGEDVVNLVCSFFS
jgi:uncharacterized protein (TIGR02147 family)